MGGSYIGFKAKMRKSKLKSGLRRIFGDLGMQKANILEETQALGKKEEMGHLSSKEGKIRLNLKEEFQRKAREEEI